MAYSDTTISSVTATDDDGELLVRWSSTLAEGAVFQVYLDRRLAWSGTARLAVVPSPRGPARIDVGSVGATEGGADLSASLSGGGGTGRRARLEWVGGSYLSPTIESFLVYRGASPGVAATIVGTPEAVVPAYPRGVRITPGVSGYGTTANPATQYRWTGETLPNGTWHFAVVPVDTAGNRGPAATVSIAISAPPGPPTNVTLAYDPATGVPTLSWTASGG